ncbi:HK97-gp10 family putative phage morphogenesis protein [Bacillus sp. FSL K6-0994]|uniref:HK97-gp10 family putative phage morphogenesis protein n=1 Tax=Bacillus sp. FSL K6-0994 TaxID=2921457 RepID=UPI00315A5310
MFNLQIDGLEELENAIGNMQRKVSKMHKEALTAGATVIKDELHPNTPRSDKEQKHMQDDLDITRLRTDGDGVKYVAVGWPKSKSRKDTQWRIHFPEFGTLHQPAQKFFTRTVEQKWDEAIRRVADKYRQALSKL